jgi:hypothetical protein
MLNDNYRDKKKVGEESKTIRNQDETELKRRSKLVAGDDDREEISH